MAGRSMMLVVTTLVLVMMPQLQPVAAGVCPDGKVRCPDLMTCCLLANGHYGCCPYPAAVCCTDRIHCCPQSMKCDTVHQACLKGGFPVKFWWKVPVQEEVAQAVDGPGHSAGNTAHLLTNSIHQVADIGANRQQPRGVCPDHYQCPDTFTCCKMHSGKYGCCPLQSATCCPDGFHCCPHNQDCLPAGGCQDRSGNMTKGKMLGRATSRVQPPTLTDTDPGGKCPDGHPCPEQFTCCRMQTGYGCCPFHEGVCCSDRTHCCPHATTCNTTTGTCDKELSTRKVPTNQQAALTRLPVTQLEGQVGGVCPDRHSFCPDGNTCCRLRDASWGCCPMPQATCCSDGEHCCPHGYHCRTNGCYRSQALHPLTLLTSHTSSQAQLSVGDTSVVQDTSEQQPNMQEETAEGVVCPDGQSECPDASTCCQMTGGQYGCCPMPGATCCGDGQHCCPHGYWCADDGCERTTPTSWLPFLTLSASSTHTP